MHCEIVNNAGMDLGDLEQHVQGMYQHFDKQIGFNKPPTIFFDSDPSNASNTLGNTAYYDPQTLEIHVFVDDRHPKDMLRSIAHELIHHQQNLEGRLDVGGYHGEGYYLHNEALKELEQEAMLEGNHYLREYEDMTKTGVQEMSLKEWKNKELFENLMGKWGIKTNILSESRDKDGDGVVVPDWASEEEGNIPKWADQDDNDPKVGDALEEAVVSIDDEFKKDYVNLKYGKKERSPEKIEQDYATLVQGKPDGRPTIPELEKMAKKGNKTAEKLAADLKSTEKPEKLDEVLGLMAMTGLAAAVVAGIGAAVGKNEVNTKKLNAFLNEPENEELTKELALLEFMGERHSDARREYAALVRKTLKSDEFRDFEPKKVDEVSTVAGVQGAPMPAKEKLQESISSILKENKKLIKRLLK